MGKRARVRWYFSVYLFTSLRCRYLFDTHPIDLHTSSLTSDDHQCQGPRCFVNLCGIFRFSVITAGSDSFVLALGPVRKAAWSFLRQKFSQKTSYPGGEVYEKDKSRYQMTTTIKRGNFSNAMEAFCCSIMRRLDVTVIVNQQNTEIHVRIHTYQRNSWYHL